MGAKADQDLWGQALAYESRYGDRATDVIAKKIDQLTGIHHGAHRPFVAR